MPVFVLLRLQYHFCMRYAVFQVLVANRSETKAFVKFQEVGLCTDLDRQVAKQTTAHLYTPLHEQLPGSGAPCIGRRYYPAD